jgi:hypothetical protein
MRGRKAELPRATLDGDWNAFLAHPEHVLTIVVDMMKDVIEHLAVPVYHE